MTPKEAIEILQEEHDYAQHLSYVNAALKQAIESLEKQIPKKPNINKRKIQCVNGHNQPTQHYKYCPMCGQLMDWSDA